MESQVFGGPIIHKHFRFKHIKINMQETIVAC